MNRHAMQIALALSALLAPLAPAQAQEDAVVFETEGLEHFVITYKPEDFREDIPEEEWFWQEEGNNIYWVSISAVYFSGLPLYPWGWKTRPHYFEDDAVSMQPAPWKPPIVWLTAWAGGIPIQFPPYPDPDSHTWDMAFELTTNMPGYADAPIPGDLNADGIVDLRDLAILAAHYLETWP